VLRYRAHRLHANRYIEYPNKIIFLFHETDSPEVLLIMHQSEIQKYVDKKDFEIQKINNIDEIIDQKKRIKKIENHFRQTITKDDILKELSRLCVGIKNVQTLSRIADRIIELRMS
jgi:Pyruvate/2-oxoacid:ferredoxin oxidoreductase gamma subunit